MTNLSEETTTPVTEASRPPESDAEEEDARPSQPRRGERSDKAHVVLSPHRRRKRLHDPAGAASAMLKLLGSAFLVLGGAELLFLWLPLQMGNAAWEFATVSRTLDALPMVALGLGLLAYGVVTNPDSDRVAARRTYWVFAVAALVVIAMAAVYATAAPAVLQGTPPEAMDGLKRTLLKSSLQLLVYGAAFSAVALTIRKRTKR